VTDVTQQLADALRPFADSLVAQENVDHPSQDWREETDDTVVSIQTSHQRKGMPDLSPDHTLWVGAFRQAREALTAFEASRAAPDDVVERVARAILKNIVQRKREIAGRASLEADEFDEMCAYEDARAALSALQAPAGDEAALADLALDYLHLAQPEFCSARCPSVGREGEAIPHRPECVSMRSLLDGLPFATPGATISTGLMAKLKKLANYLTEQGEYEACDLIDTVVDRLSASPPTPARDEGLEALRELLDEHDKAHGETKYTPAKQPPYSMTMDGLHRQTFAAMYAYVRNKLAVTKRGEG